LLIFYTAICAYPQAKQRTETALAEKVADFGRLGCWPPAARMAGTCVVRGFQARKRARRLSEPLYMVADG